MQLLLSCAKDMSPVSSACPALNSKPIFQEQANKHAIQMLDYTAEELKELFNCNSQLAALNRLRYQTFFEQEPLLQAILSYTGMAYKRLNAKDFTEDDYAYAQEHLWMTSFLYGLLRPMDLIKNYRLEGYAELPEYGGKNLFDFWKPLLTRTLIDAVKKDDGILVNLASAEMKKLFDWAKIRREVSVIDVDFLIHKDGKYKNIVIYTKACRGGMVRYIIKKRIEYLEGLRSFYYEGFEYSERYSTDTHLKFLVN